MSKRILSVVLSLALLLSAVSVAGFTAHASEEVVITPVTEMPAGNNLLLGMYPTAGVSGEKSLTSWKSSQYPLTNLVDGNLNTAWRGYETTGYRVFFNLGTVAEIESFLVGSFTEATEYRINQVKIYTSETVVDKWSLFAEEYLAIDATGMTELHNLVSVAGKTFTAACIGFDISGSYASNKASGQTFYGELGAYGTPTAAYADTKVTAITELPTETNLLSGLTPFKANGTTALGRRSSSEGEPATLVNGVLGETTPWGGWFGDQSRIVFDLGSVYNLNKFLIGSVNDSHEYVRFADVYVGNDVSKLFTADTLVMSASGYTKSLALSRDNVLTSKTNKTFTGRYVAFDFTNNEMSESKTDDDPGGYMRYFVRLAELGVYGSEFSETPEEKEPYIVVDEMSDLPEGESLISNVIATQPDGSRLNHVSGSNREGATDGLIQGLNQTPAFKLTQDMKTATSGGNTYYSYIAPKAWVEAQGLDSNQTWYIQPENGRWFAGTVKSQRLELYASDPPAVYDMGAVKRVDSIFIASTAEPYGMTNDTFYNGAYDASKHPTMTEQDMVESMKPVLDKRLLWAGKVYVGEDRDTLISEENLVLEFDLSDNIADALRTLWTLDEPAEGRYIAFDFDASAFYDATRISELAVYGNQTSEEPEEKEPYIVVDEMSDLPEGESLISNVIATQPDGSRLNHMTGSNREGATDGLIQGLNQIPSFKLTQDVKTATSGGNTYYSYIAPTAWVEAQGLDTTQTWYIQPENGRWFAGTARSQRLELYASDPAAVYDMGAVKRVESILIASTAEPYGMTNETYYNGAYDASKHPTMTEQDMVNAMKPVLDKRLLWAGKVYVGEDRDTLISEDNLVLEFDLSDNMADALRTLWTLAEPVEGRYIAFDFDKSAFQDATRISELAVYGTQIADEPAETYYTVVDEMSDLPEGESLISNIIATQPDGSRLNHVTGSNREGATDSLIQGLNQALSFKLTQHIKTATSGGNTYYSYIAPKAWVEAQGLDSNQTWYIEPENGRWFAGTAKTQRYELYAGDPPAVYDMGAVKRVDSIFIASTAEPYGMTNETFYNGAYDASKHPTMTEQDMVNAMKPVLDKRLLWAGRVYVSETLEDIISEDNLVLDFDLSDNIADALRTLWTLAEPVEGRYIAFDFNESAYYECIRISELAVYGGTPEEREATFQVVDSLDDLPEKENLISVMTPTKADGTKVDVVGGTKLANMTDGLIQGLNQENHFVLTDDPQYKTVTYEGKTYYAYVAPAEMVEAQGLDTTKTWYVKSENPGLATNDAELHTALYGDTAKVVYDIGVERKIQSILFASSIERQGALISTEVEGAYDAAKHPVLNYEEAMKPVSADKRLLWTAKVYISKDKATVFNESNLELEFDLSENIGEALRYLWSLPRAVKGRYIGFDFGAAAYDELVRISELAVYGDLDKLQDIAFTGFDSQAEMDALVNGQANLLKGDALSGLPNNYLPNIGSADIDSNEEWLSDGRVDWDGDSAESVVYSNADYASNLVYDFCGKVDFSGLLLSNAGNEEAASRVLKVSIYVGDDMKTILATKNHVGTARLGGKNVGAYVDLSAKNVEGRYMALVIPGDTEDYKVRLAELGVYGTYLTTPEKFATSLLGGKLPVYYQEIFARSIDNKTAVDVNGHPGAGNTGKFTGEIRDVWKYDDLALLTDGNIDTVSMQACSASPYNDLYHNGQARYLEYDTNWIVLIYRLDGKSRIDDITLTSGSNRELYVSGVQYYASESYADLFKNESLLYTTGGEYFVPDEENTVIDPENPENTVIRYLPDASTDHNAERAIGYTLTTAQSEKLYRYVAVVMTRPHGMYNPNNPTQRLTGWCKYDVGEITVNGALVERVPPLKDTYTVETSVGEVTVQVSTLHFGDTEFFANTLAGVKVIESKLPVSVNPNIADNWLSVDNDNTVFTFQLVDKNGKVIPETHEDESKGVNGRELEFTLPATTTEYLQTMAVLKDGELSRLYNSFPNILNDGKISAGALNYPEYAAGLANNRDKAVLSGAEISLVYMKLNDIKTINRLNDQLSNGSLADFVAGDIVAGATVEDEVNVLWYILPALAVIIAAATVIVLMRRKARRVGQ